MSGLNFAPALGRAGAVMGGAGGGIMGRLGSLLEPLDYARQAAWNIPDKLSEGDFVGALPGLAGAGLTAGLAATGFGLPIAAAAGTALGALGQGVGKAWDSYNQPAQQDPDAPPPTSHFQAKNPGDLLQALGMDPDSAMGTITGMGIGALTDPLTYTGGTIGRSLMRGLAPGLENAARLRGPQYPGGAEKILGGPEMWAKSAEAASVRAPRMMQEIAGSPYGARVLGEIPPGSTPLGAGMEGVAFRTPEGHVIRIGGGGQSWDTIKGIGFNGEPATGTRFPLGTDGLNGDVMFPHVDPIGSSTMAPPAPRTDSNLMLQPGRDIAIGPYRVEHLPRLATIPTSKIERGLSLTPQEEALFDMIKDGKPALDSSVIGGGGRLVDAHVGNMGVSPQGNLMYSDPGAIAGIGSTAERLPGAPPTGFLKNKLLDALGANQGVRNEIGQNITRAGEQGLNQEQIEAIFKRMYGEDARDAQVYAGRNLLPGADMPPTVADAGRILHPSPGNSFGSLGDEELLRQMELHDMPDDAMLRQLGLEDMVRSSRRRPTWDQSF